MTPRNPLRRHAAQATRAINALTRLVRALRKLLQETLMLTVAIIALGLIFGGEASLLELLTRTQ